MEIIVKKDELRDEITDLEVEETNSIDALLIACIQECCRGTM